MVNGYLLMLGSLILIGGSLGDLFGERRVFALGVSGFGVASAILLESSLSFLGFGMQAPTPSWGDILSEARLYIDFAWWLAFFPGLAILVTIMSYNFVGEGLRDAVDPRLRIK